VTGRFLNKDPVSGSVDAGQTLNPYAYALNNPVRFVDVSGLSASEGGKASNVYGPSDELHAGYFAYGRQWQSKASAENYRRALRQKSFAYRIDSAVNDRLGADLFVMEKWVELVKVPIDVTMDFVSIGPGPAGLVGKAYGMADTAIQVGVATYQASQGQLKSSDALKLVSDVGISIVEHKIAAPGTEFAVKALIY
jgi:hypothetical protein